MSGELALGVDRDHRLASLERAPGEGLRERHLLAGEIGARQVPGRARHEASVGRAQEEQAALHAGPQHQGVDDAVEQRAEALAVAERADERLQIARLLGAEHALGRGRGARHPGQRADRGGELRRGAPA